VSERPAGDAEPAAAIGAAEFAAAIAALGPWEPCPQVAAAVSGGPDSLCLALLAGEWTRALGGTLLCLIVDHGLRPESADEAERVQGWLTLRGLDAAILRGGPEGPGSVQERARRLRYRLLMEHCIRARIPHLLLAHHRNDQAETVLMRIAHGSGLRGLAGMASASLAPGSAGRVRLLRPLLQVPKARLASTLRALAQDWVEDPSNRDLRHERVRWRALMPVLAAGGVDPARLAAAAERLAYERAALDRTVASWLARASALSPYGHASVRMEEFGRLPPAIAEAALARLLGAVGGSAYPPRRESLADLAVALRRAPSRLSRTLAGCGIRLEHGRMQVTREPAAVLETVPGRPGLLLWDGRFELRLGGPSDRLGETAISCLNAQGWAEVREIMRRSGARLPTAPARQLWTLPALRVGGRLVEVPHLPGLFPGAGVGASVSWAPRQPLTG
jgi:tRNA(Ile)-lysidine synthase